MMNLCNLNLCVKRVFGLCWGLICHGFICLELKGKGRVLYEQWRSARFLLWLLGFELEREYSEESDCQ